MSDWRAGGSMERLSQRSSVSSYKKGSPSVSRGYIHEEITEMTRWANQYLNVGGFSDHLITDLTSDLSDGITLVRLVQSLAGEQLPRYLPNPMMKVQKIQNFQVVLDYLKEVGIQLAVHPEDLAGGNMKAALAVCKALQRHYTAGPSPPTGRGVRGQRSFRYSSLDKEDMAVLSWVGDMVHRNITEYTTLYDGKVLCELVNQVQEGVIQDQGSWGAEQRLAEVFSASEHHFYIPHSNIDISKISTGSQDTLLRAFLQQLKTVHIQKARHQPLTSTRPHTAHSSQGELFSSYSSSRMSRQQREEAKIAARTYEGLRQARKAGSYTDLTDSGPRTLTKHSSTEALQKAPLFAPLNRHHSVDTGIAPPVKKPPPAMLRSTSQTIPQHRSSLLELNTPTFESRGLAGRRTASYTRLENGSVDELTALVTALEERVATLTAQFLYERHDMFKRMDKALVRERKRRQTLEKRLREVEGLARSIVKQYDSRIIEMAQQVSQLRGELMIAQDRPTTVTMEIQGLKEKVRALSESEHMPRQTVPAAQGTPQHKQVGRRRSHTLFVRKNSESDLFVPKPSPLRKRSTTHATKPPPVSKTPEKVYSRGSVTSFRKLSNFFGVEPPRIEDITTFLDGLGYSDLIQLFIRHDVTLAELSVMTDKDLERLGVPLGPRLRILQELKTLKPLDEGTVI